MTKRFLVEVRLVLGVAHRDHYFAVVELVDFHLEELALNLHGEATDQLVGLLLLVEFAAGDPSTDHGLDLGELAGVDLWLKGHQCGNVLLLIKGCVDLNCFHLNLVSVVISKSKDLAACRAALPSQDLTSLPLDLRSDIVFI